MTQPSPRQHSDTHTVVPLSELSKLKPFANTYTNFLALTFATSITAFTYAYHIHRQRVQHNADKAKKPNYTMRLSRPDECDAVTAHMHGSFEEYMMRTHNSHAQPESRYYTIVKRCSEPNSTVHALIAVDSNGDSNIFGCLVYNDCDDIIAIQSITVSPEVSKHGIAKALLTDAFGRFDSKRTFALTQFLGNHATFALYTKVGFNILMHVSAHSGRVTFDQLQLWSSQLSSGVEVTTMKENDISDCDKLHKEVLGASRVNDIHNTLRESHDRNGIALVARQANRIVGYCTSATTSEGHWLWTDANVFKALYITAQTQLNERPDVKDDIFVLMPHSYPAEVRFLLSAKGVLVKTQLTVMFTNFRLPDQDKHRYAPSTYY